MADEIKPERLRDDEQTERLQQERWEVLSEISDFLDKPMIALSFVWLVLVLIDLNQGLSPVLSVTSDIIWGLFILDFVIELLIAPHRLAYIQRNWLTAISILLPAFRILQVFRVLRFFRLARLGRSVSLLRLLTSVRRSMRAVNTTLERRGFGWVMILTLMVIGAGAAGMAHFESPQALQEAGILNVSGLRTYGDALWWTAMLMTTMGSDYWPKTLEGRILGWTLAMYAFTVFGYITATLASHFIRTDADKDQVVAK